MNKRLKFLLLGIAGCYVLATAGLYFFQEKIMFHPVTLPNQYQFRFTEPFEEKNFRLKDGAVINAVLFRAPNPKGAVLLLHGNSGNISNANFMARQFTNRGFDCLIPDYPGYGKSRGRLSEENLFETADRSYAFLRQSWPNDHIVIYGRSLGTGIAAYQARKAGWCRALFMEAPYSSIVSVAASRYRWFPVRQLCRYNIRTVSYLKNVICPIFAIHGTDDSVIPIEEENPLKALQLNNFHLTVVPGGSHNDLQQSAAYQHLLDSVLVR